MAISIQLPRFRSGQAELLERLTELEAARDVGIAATYENELLVERLVELELAIEDQGWMSIGGFGDNDFSREKLRVIGRNARLFYLKNPLINRGVNVQVYYVFGQGVNIRAEDETVNEVVQAFLDDARNQAEFTSQQSMEMKERELRILGNLFFVFFTEPKTGRVTARTIPVDEIEEVVCDPEDAKAPWMYKRMWASASGAQQTEYYPDWRFAPPSKPATAPDGKRVNWDMPVYHVKTGGLPDMRFGVSEIYSALDWAKAYTQFLEDWATLTRAYSRFSHRMSLPTKSDLAAAKTRLNTTMGASSGETNPKPLVGSMALTTPGVDISPMRIGGANVSAEDGRRMLLMVAAAVGLPETFFGDVSVGTLATANSLDRPTELKMVSRQTLWSNVFGNILDWVILQAVKAGALSGTVTPEIDGTPIVELEIDPKTGDPRDATVLVTFPPILEHDIGAGVDAVVKAATLDGKASTGWLDERELARMLLDALGETEIDAMLDRLYPPDEEGEPKEPAPETEEFVMALRDLREAVRVIISGE